MDKNDKAIIMQYLGRFGDKKPSEFGFAKAYLCPECKGEGVLTNRSSDGRGDYTYECRVCYGVGYTEQEKKPKMVQVGWE